MKTISWAIAIAMALTATQAFSQSKPKPPLQQCRENNQDNLDQLKERTNAAARNFDVTTAQGKELLAKRDALRGVPGQAGSLKNCQEKAQEIAALGDKTSQIIAASDKPLAACRREARDSYNTIEASVENEQYLSIKLSGRLTAGNRAEFSNYRAAIQDVIAKGEARGFTMADCNLQKSKIAAYRAYFESICFKDLYTQGKPTICLKVQ